MKRKHIESLFFIDPITTEEDLINSRTKLYLVQTGENTFALGGIKGPFEAFPYDPHLWHRGSIYAANPHSPYAQRYWTISNKAIFINKVLNHVRLNVHLFPEREGHRILSTSAMLTREDVIELTGIRPNDTNVKTFSTACNQENVETWQRERLTEITFFEWLAGYFQARITEDNINDIEKAVQALYTTKHGEISAEHIDILKRFDISNYAKETLSTTLKTGPLAANTNEYIASFFELSAPYTTYAQRYYLQTSLIEIVRLQKEEIEADTENNDYHFGHYR